MWPLISDLDLEIWRQFFWVLPNEISGHIFWDSNILLIFHTNECFTTTQLPRSVDWFWLRGWLINKVSICTGSAPLFVCLFVVIKPENPYSASHPGLVNPLGVYPIGPRSFFCGPTKGIPPPRNNFEISSAYSKGHKQELHEKSEVKISLWVLFSLSCFAASAPITAGTHTSSVQ